VWVVSGHNGENLIRAEGPSGAAAWRAALEQARAVGMVRGWRVSELDSCPFHGLVPRGAHDERARVSLWSPASV
jgi:hypothetical protein